MVFGRNFIYGLSANPPANHHRDVVRKVLARFNHADDQIIVIPCGPRPDKETTNDIAPIHRATMTDMTFRGMPRVTIDLDDLERDVFTRTKVLEERYRGMGETWFVVGSDLVQAGRDGRSPIHDWEDGVDLWNRLNFVVVPRDGYPCEKEDLPPHVIVLGESTSGSSSVIREKILRGGSYRDGVVPAVAAYIDRYGLYRVRMPTRVGHISIEEPRILLEYDPDNTTAVTIAESFKPFVHESNPNCIVVIGGDGKLLHTVQKHWRRRLPFCGINAGHVGFNLNQNVRAWVDDPRKCFRELNAYHCPMLYTRMWTKRTQRSHVGLNDVYLEKVDQTTWVEVTVNGKVRIRRLGCNVLAVATPVGSTAYTRNMGATPMFIKNEGMVMAAGVVSTHRSWSNAHLPDDASVDLRVLDLWKRPAVAYVDGQNKGQIERMNIRMSRIAAAELLCSPECDFAEKRIDDQFPE